MSRLTTDPKRLSIFEMLVQTLLGPQTPHAHKCGFDLDDPTARGCGCEWSHDPAQLEDHEEHRRAHFCPSCGRGPWSWQLTPETKAEYAKRYNKAA